jgi:hypothetical protein
MCVFCTVAYTGAAISLAISGSGASFGQLLTTSKEEPSASKILQLQSLPESLTTVRVPKIKEPQWLVDQKAAEQVALAAAKRKVAGIVTVTYDVTTRGAITANLAEFKQQANATLNDARGWSRLGAVFKEVSSGGQFTLVLSEASQLPTFSPGCSADYSCNAGRYVVINQDRWLGATASWNAASGTIRDYRHMVINHETGHWLGHGHESCGGAGQPAPVMQQQSISLQGCNFNPWPLAGELWSTQLGVKL